MTARLTANGTTYGKLHDYVFNSQAEEIQVGKVCEAEMWSMPGFMILVASLCI